MVKPRYIAQHVNDDYVLVRVDPVGHMGRAVAGGVGAMLLSSGIVRRGLAAIVASATGAALLYHAATGRNPIDLVKCRSAAAQGRKQDTPSYPGNHKRSSKQVAKDSIDEASMESFPASDPPASHRKRNSH